MQKKIKLLDYYTTSDLALAATMALFFPIATIYRRDAFKANFMFRREEGMDELIEDFWKGEIRIDPLKYFNQLKAIKARIYEGKK